MPGKQKIPAPIDRPLSKAYLRGFKGWSTAYPPGISDPTSLRIMENMWVTREKALAVRPGLRYMSYLRAPDMDPENEPIHGTGIDRPMVGTNEPFFLRDGSRALLFAVREEDGTVGFRALRFTATTSVVYRLTDPEIGFDIPQGEESIRFTSATTHVEYLQIDNKILALSDAGEPFRLFFVGAEKIVKRMSSISVPEWEDDDRIKVVHPAAQWINGQGTVYRRNLLLNPSFEIGTQRWTRSDSATWSTSTAHTAQSGSRVLELRSRPTRTNMIHSPLHDMAQYGTQGWKSSSIGSPKLGVNNENLQISTTKGSGRFFAYSSKFSHNVSAGRYYKVAVYVTPGPNVTPQILVSFYSASGALIGSRRQLDPARKNYRYESSGIKAPTGAVAMRIHLGGVNERSSQSYVRYRNIVVCRSNESTAALDGDTGANNSWLDPTKKNASPSVHHPPADVTVTSDKVSIPASEPLTASLYVQSTSGDLSYSFTLRGWDKDAKEKGVDTTTGTTGEATWKRASATVSPMPATAVTAHMSLTVEAVPRGTTILVDAGLLEPRTVAVGEYFDGTTPGTDLISNYWADSSKPHEVRSIQKIVLSSSVAPPAEEPTAKTLVALGGADANQYKIGFFYAFENEVGESAHSKITEIRVSRPWSNWRMETANADGEPSGDSTDDPNLAADQLVLTIPEHVYLQAISEGALRWNLYAFNWSDQDAVPTSAYLVKSRDIYPDETSSLRAPALSYQEGGWLNITPQRRAGITQTLLPAEDNRENFSRPLGSRTGLVAGDRIILLGDPTELSTIRWSANRPGEYVNFTPSFGGGAKTLSQGNLSLPAAIVLWQNPQSVDTLTILCIGVDDRTPSFYMAPGTVGAGGSGTTTVMNFEETTNTPGTVSPYAAEVMNNALYRPTSRYLLKSTAQNYNISHRALSDDIANMWATLESRLQMTTAQLDNRLYLLVHNPNGEQLIEGCKGNEIWVYDVGMESGSWSRLLIQAIDIRPFEVGGMTYMGVTRPEGLYYLDDRARLDDYVTDTPERLVETQQIPWAFETNTQGANRAHDAWAHLQMATVLLGNFHGSMEYGLHGKDVNGQDISMTKAVSDFRPVDDNAYGWDIEDSLLIRRDMKEWVFFARSMPGVPSSGQIGYVQYRYTPVSVNVGYEFGSVETFEYGSNVAEGPNGYSENGIPLPYMDYERR